MPWKEEHYFLSTAYIEDGYRVLGQIGINWRPPIDQGELGAFFMKLFFDGDSVGNRSHFETKLVKPTS
jgi:hypothetical protein